MNRGIYIIANDKVLENAIALLNSIRYHDPYILIYLIPFNEHYQQVASTLQQRYNVQLFPDLDYLEKFTHKIGEIFPRNFLALPHKMRKLIQWFGPLDEFLYIDTDILVFTKIADILNYLNEYEFINCDYHYKNRKLIDIFSPIVQEKGIFTDEQLADVFNSGFWASKKGIFSETQLYSLLEDCSQHREYFDFSQKTTDQPLLNYIILKSTTKRLNLVKLPGKEPGNWAGSPHFQEKEHLLYDGNIPLRYLHWAGQPMRSGGPYREIWEYYRYLGETKPTEVSLSHSSELRWWQRLRKVKEKVLGK